MISKNFYFQVILRILLLTGTLFGFSYIILGQQYFVSSVICIFIIIQVVMLIQYINRTNRKIAYFFESIKNEDFTLRFPEKINVKSLKELNKSLNLLNAKIQEIHLKNEAQEKYYLEILKQADIGIMTINKKGHILFANPQIEKLLNYSPLNHIKQLNQIDISLYELFISLKPFEQKLITLTNEREKRQIALKSTPLLSNNQELLLVVAQDIHKELDEKETGSWIKLIRVLTHEIMNTITPITSISDSILRYFKNDNSSSKQIDNQAIENTIKGLEVIKEQGSDLMEFVQSYRSFLNLPKPDRTLVSAHQFLDKIITLMKAEIEKNNTSISLLIDPSDIEFYIDEKQLSQVIINLIKNALYALENIKNGKINIIAGVNSQGKKFVEITDNGTGISADIIEQIFVPFFTTKDKGSGIGLSLSKQIMHLHNGTLNVHSVPNKITSFTLTFN